MCHAPVSYTHLGSVLVINLLDLVHAEGTDLSALTAAGTSITVSYTHLLSKDGANRKWAINSMASLCANAISIGT